MQVNRRRSAARNGVVAGSVWETRMKIDEGKGGIKVFNGGENPAEDQGAGFQVPQRLKSSPIDVVVRNRKTWKSEIEGNPIQLGKTRTDLLAKSAEDFDGDRILRGNLSNVGQIASRRIVLSNEDGDDDEDEDDEEEMEVEKEKESIDIKEVNSVEEKQRTIEQKEKIHQIHEIPCVEKQRNVSEKKINEQAIPPFKQRSVAEKEKLHQIQEKLRQIHEIPTSQFKHRNVPEKEKLHQIHEIPVSPFKRRSIEEKEKLHQIHEIPISPFKQRNVAEKDKLHQIHEIPQYVEKQRSLAEKQKFYQFHEVPTSPDMEKQPSSIDHPSVDPDLTKPEISEYVEKQRSLAEKQKLYQFHEILSSADMGKQPPPTIDHPSVDVDLTKPPPIAVGEELENIQETQNRLQSIVDLVMWRDISKSAFVFGLGTFILLSSSFASDLNFSLISVFSYLGLFYLVAIFFYKSILGRGATDIDDEGQKYMVGEEEAIWVLKLILPYFNELLIQIRDLFSGEPATTMKLAILLFVLARCGSSITIWKMTKLAFFGVFTLPKFCSAYSNQITGNGKFWVQRFGDAWDSCTHKKGVAAAIFTVTWNLSSVTARIWAVFMLIVAIRLYQQSSLIKEEWCETEAGEDSRGGQGLRQKKDGPTQTEPEKGEEKKGF